MTCVIVTGATGYIGGHLVRAARGRGWDVVAASRTRPAECLAWIPYCLDDSLDASAFPMGATVVHLAADTSSGTGDTVEREAAAARRLLDVAMARHLAIVFVSSQAARRGAPSAYGRAKWQVEQLVLEGGGTVVRPGLVYGGRPGGLFRQLLQQVRGAVALPALLPAPRVQPIHVDDLVEGLLRVAVRADLRGTALNLGSRQPVSFTSFLRSIASHRLRCRRFFVPLPTLLLAPAVRVANVILRRAIDPGRVRSLVDLPAMHCDEDLSHLDLRLRPLASGMCPSGSDRRRRLLQEGRGLIGYLLGERAPAALLRRYVRAIERVRDGRPVALPVFLVQWPSCIGIVDSAALLRTAGADELGWRLEAATALAEASPAGAHRFLMLPGASGFMSAVASLTAAMLSEAFWRPARVLAAPMLARALAQRDDER